MITITQFEPIIDFVTGKYIVEQHYVYSFNGENINATKETEEILLQKVIENKDIKGVYDNVWKTLVYNISLADYGLELNNNTIVRSNHEGII